MKVDKFKKGDIVYHKATQKRGVVKGPGQKGALLVTTEDNQVNSYQPEELWSEVEWEARMANFAASSSEKDWGIGQ